MCCFIYICWTVASGSTWPLPRKPVWGPQKAKNASFCRKEPFEGSPGPTEQAVRGPPCKSENETWMWSLNCPPCGHRTAFQIGHFWHFLASLILLETPIFIVFCTNPHLRCLNLRQKIGQNFRPSKTNLNWCRAVLWTPNCPSKFHHECKPRKKESHHKKTTTTRNPNASFCRKKRFREKWKKHLSICWPLVCWPFSGQRPLNTIAQKHYKTRFFFCAFFGWCALNKTKQQQQQQQQQQTTTTNIEKEGKWKNEKLKAKKKYPGKQVFSRFAVFFLWGVLGQQQQVTRITTIETKTRIKQNKNNTKTNDNTKPTNKKKLSIKHCVVFWCYFSLVLVVAQTTKTQQQNHSTTKQPTNNKNNNPKKKQQKTNNNRRDNKFSFFSLCF